MAQLDCEGSESVCHDEILCDAGIICRGSTEVHTHRYTYTHTQTHTHNRCTTHTERQTHTHTHTHNRQTYVCMFVCVHTDMHTLSHTHTHPCIPVTWMLKDCTRNSEVRGSVAMELSLRQKQCTSAILKRCKHR